MASSRRSPATRTDSLTTMPYMEMMAASVRPPPISTIMWPWGELTGMRAPMAAARGSGVGGAAGAGGLAGVLDGALLHAGDAGGDADHDLRLDEGEAANGAADEVAEHGFRGHVIGDDAVAHGADELEGAGGGAG